MATVKDLNNLMFVGLGFGQLSSMTIVKKQLVKECIVALGDQLMITHDLSDSEEVDKLPDDTELGAEVEVHYNQLKELLNV